MLNIPEKDKLLPLRRFADSKLYSLAYLSILVQRKKLKAKKIGRNYYTCVRWLEEYLEKHARDDFRYNYENKIIKSENQLAKVGFFVWPKTLVKKIFTTLVVILVIFVLFFFGNQWLNHPKGIVAGESEANQVSE
jgi:hypothetical protein